MNYLKTILISVLTTIILGLVVYYFVPLWEIDRFIRENLLGATVTEISGSDTMSNFPTVYNANLSSMNSAKAEVSTTTLNNVTSIPNLATIGTITTGTWTSTDIGVAYGGTGASTLGSNLVLLGNGTGAIQSVTAGSNDQVLTLVAGVPAWQSGTIDETLNYAWTGQHSWTTGTTTFNSAVSLVGYTSATSLQIASSSAPTPDKDTEVANKKYVDDSLNSYGFGDYETLVFGTDYYATSTGILVAYAISSDASGLQLIGYEKSTTPPNTVITKSKVIISEYEVNITMPVKQGHYFKAAIVGNNSAKYVRFIPLE